MLTLLVTTAWVAGLWFSTPTQPTHAASVYYVTPTGSGDCSDWAHACGLQTALGLAGNGAEIWVAAGTYLPGPARTDTFKITKNVAIYGGFNGTETSREQHNPTTHITTLSGDIGEAMHYSGGMGEVLVGYEDNNYHVITVEGATTTLDGLTIHGGFADAIQPIGGGILQVASSGGNTTLNDVIIVQNRATECGGGIVLNTGSSMRIYNSAIVENDALSGGGICSSGSLSIENSTIAKNAAQSYGGGIEARGNLQLAWSTVVDNRIGDTAETGAGIWYYKIFFGDIAISHSIVAQNGWTLGWTNCAGVASLSNLSNLTDDNTCGSGFTNSTTIHLGTPGKYGGATYTYPLLSGSAAIDAVPAGTAGCGTDIVRDQRGALRPQNSACDLGAFEYDSNPPDTSLTGQPGNPSSDPTPTFEFSGTDDGTPPASLAFDCKMDAGDWTACASPKTYSSLSVGAHTFQVRAKDFDGHTDLTPVSYTWSYSGDNTPPDTRIDNQPLSFSNDSSPTFEFSGTDDGTPPGSLTFTCKLDDGVYGTWHTCSTPMTYTGQGNGSHTFQVRAKDSFNNTDATPASYTWTIDTLPPTALTGGVSDLTPTGVTLNGLVNPNGGRATVVFDYGLTTSYGDTKNGSPSPIDGSTDTPVSAIISGLQTNTLYHYRVRATDINGTGYGNDLTFTTPCSSAIAVTSANESGAGSLRQAIIDACSGGTITFDNDTTIALSSLGGLTIDKDLTIDGSGRRVTISGADVARVFTVKVNTHLNLQNLTIAHGGGVAFGAGLFAPANSVVYIRNSTFIGNKADMVGGAVYNLSGQVTIENSTFSENTAASGGGGLYNDSGTLSVTHSTFAANGGALYNRSGATLTVKNSLLVNSIASSNCQGTFTNGGGNLQFGGTAANSCGAAIPVLDPQLGALADHGGRTQTFALLPTSPAIDRGDAASCLTTDQRGLPRTDLGCDAGAFELKYSDSNQVQRTVNSTSLTTFGPTLTGFQRDASFSDPGVITVTKSTTWSTPGPNAIKVWWEITPTVTTNISLTLKLCYTDAESNLLAMEDLRVWQLHDGKWAAVGGTPITSRDASGNNCALISGVTTFSAWTLASSNPTAIQVTRFSATSDGPAGWGFGFASIVGCITLFALARSLRQYENKRKKK
jgi:hypothetical protein